MKTCTGYTNNKGVCFRYGISRTTLYRRIKEGRFPAPTGLAGKGNWWDNQTLDAYDKKLRDKVLKSVNVAAGNV